MTTTFTPCQRIAAVLRERGIERTAAEVDGWLEHRFDLYSVAHQSAAFEVFAEHAATSIEEGEPRWIGALVAKFGGTL